MIWVIVKSIKKNNDCCPKVMCNYRIQDAYHLDGSDVILNITKSIGDTIVEGIKSTGEVGDAISDTVTLQQFLVFFF